MNNTCIYNHGAGISEGSAGAGPTGDNVALANILHASDQDFGFGLDVGGGRWAQRTNDWLALGNEMSGAVSGTHGMVNRGVFSLNAHWGGDTADGLGNASRARAHSNASYYFYNPSVEIGLKVKTDDESGAKSDDDGSSVTHAARKVFVSMFAESTLDAEGMHAFANVMINENLTALLEAHKKFGVPGFLDIQKAGVWAMPAASSQNQNETGLAPGWRAALDKLLDAAMPHFASKALVGVFMGDETMCGGVSVANFTAVSDAVKARVGTSGLVAANECTLPFTTANTRDHYAGSVAGKLPASLDIISVDTYAAANRPAHCSTVPAPPSWGSCSYRVDRDFNPETKGAPAGRCCCPASQPWCRSNEPATEANSTRAFYERFLVPHLLAHQKLFLIPGLFGVKWNCSDPAYVSRLFTLIRAHALSSRVQLCHTPHCAVTGLSKAL